SNSVELLKAVEDSDYLTDYMKKLVSHNKVVFKRGEGALQTLPPLTELIPEAKQNLTIFHLRNELTQDAYALMRDHQPATPLEYTLKGIVFTLIGQV
ncbi:MAG: putative intraflagellar transport protein 56, partial [Streblomastix strix]